MTGKLKFDDLARLSDHETQRLLREVDAKDCTVALKGASDAVNTKFLGNMSERVRKVIKGEMERLGTMAPEEIEAAQQRILKQAAQLGEQREISWPPE
ncbi:MAG: hypothetical protein HYW07_00660 [Candidatus Latescibacteria bacterium]|nr:hypothetical protein [Candidatus Latescibacterota bacterium]